MVSKYALLILVLLLAVFVSPFLFLQESKGAIIETTRTFSTATTDGYIEGYTAVGLPYGEVRNATYGTVRSYYPFLTIGQAYGAPSNVFDVYRAYVPFDTSIIPDNATVTSVILSLYVASDFSTVDFNVTIQNGQPTYPHFPLQTTDYNMAYYSGNGGTKNTSTITGAGYWNITLTSDGRSWVSLTGTTKLCLRSSRDIGNTAPGSDAEDINIWAAEYGESYAPKLYVTYEQEGYLYIVHGPYYEDGTVANTNTSLTIQIENSPSETYYLNGTDAVADTLNITTEQRGIALTWNITMPIYNRTRSYYFLPTETFEEIWIFLPSEGVPSYLYSFTVNDFLGITNGFLETVKNVEGQNRIIERYSLTTINAIPFWLAWGERYDIRMTCDQGTYTWGGFLALTEQTINLVIVPGMFPSTYPGYNLTVNALRQNATWVQANYTDNEAVTSWVYLEVKYRSGSSWTTDYYLNSSGSVHVFNWYDATAATSYVATLTALRSGVETSWSFSLPTPSNYTNPWTGLLDGLGVWPVPSETIFGFFIVLAVFAVFSYFYLPLGVILGVVLAAFLNYINWLNISWSLIGLGFVVGIFVVIQNSKREEREL